MKGHLDNTEIIGFINGESGEKAPSVAAHIAECPQCRKRHAEMLSLVAPTTGPVPGPRRGLEKRILATYRGYGTGTTSGVAMRGIPGWIAASKPRAALAAAVIVALVGASLYFGISHLTRREVLPIYVYYFRGSSSIDDERVRYHMPIRDRSEIRVGRGSVLVLACKRRFIVKLFGNSEMILKRLPVSRGQGGHQFVFNLRKGTIFTTYRQNSVETKYFYFTPNASLATRKSSFIMKVAGNRTIVIPKDGAINIRSFMAKGIITASPEKDYVISSSIEINDPSDRQETRDLRMYLEQPFSNEEILRLRQILDSII
ncbi:MAG: hypothetical protein JXA20_02845 [Spirochaetes bacterium]|nr:hypothetical protein [Spirochaetota bacterium]